MFHVAAASVSIRILRSENQAIFGSAESSTSKFLRQPKFVILSFFHVEFLLCGFDEAMCPVRGNFLPVLRSINFNVFSP